MTEDVEPFVVFSLERQRYALPLPAVERIVRAVEVTALPKAPTIVIGLINLEGRVLPVIDLRRRLGLPARELHPSHHFLICWTGQRAVVLIVDESLGVITINVGERVTADGISPGLQPFEGALKLQDGLVLIYDVEKFLTPTEEAALSAALQGSEDAAAAATGNDPVAPALAHSPDDGTAR